MTIEKLVADASMQVAQARERMKGNETPLHQLEGRPPITVGSIVGGLPKAPILTPSFPNEGSPLKVDGIKVAGKHLSHWILGDYALRDMWVALALSDSFAGRSVDLATAGVSWNKLIQTARMNLAENPDIWSALQMIIKAGRTAKTPPIGILSNAIGLVQGLTEVDIAVNRGIDLPLDGHFRDIALVQAVASITFAALLRGDEELMHPDEGEGDGYIEYIVKAAGITENQDKVFQAFRAQAMLMLYHGDGNVSTVTGLFAHSGSTNMAAVAQAILAGLGGVNHGAAAQQCAQQFFKAWDTCEGQADAERLDDFFQDIVQAQQRPLFGGGHRVVEQDPRTGLQLELIGKVGNEAMYAFADAYVKALELAVARYTQATNHVVNVDSLTGAVWQSLGLIHPERLEQSYQMTTCFFGLARITGAMVAAYWRAPKLSKGKLVHGPALMRPNTLPYGLKEA